MAQITTAILQAEKQIPLRYSAYPTCDLQPKPHSLKPCLAALATLPPLTQAWAGDKAGANRTKKNFPLVTGRGR